MEWKNNVSVTNLFANNRIVTIYSEQAKCQFIAPSIRDSLNDSLLNKFLGLVQSNKLDEMVEKFKMHNTWELMLSFLSNPLITNLKEFKIYYEILHHVITDFCINCSVDKTRQVIWNGVVVDDDLWEAFIQALFQTCLIEKKQVKHFASEAAKKLWEQQQEAEAKIAKINGENKANDRHVLVALLTIKYAFPSFTTDELLNLSMLQFIELQKIANNYASYHIEEMAYSMGNLKGAPAFFIK